MTKFACSECDYESKYKHHMTKHIYNRHDGDGEVTEIDSDNTCDYCGKNFISYGNLNRHAKTCKTKTSETEALLLSEIKHLKEEIGKIKGESSTINNTNNTNNTDNSTNNSNNTVNNTINVTLTPWNEPNLENIDNYCKKAIKHLFLSVPKLIKYVHFNEDTPENHNISVKNFRNKYAKVYNGTNWETIKKEELYDALSREYESVLDDFVDRYPNYQKFMDKYNHIKDRDGEEKVLVDLNFEINRVIYDLNYMIDEKKQ